MSISSTITYRISEIKWTECRPTSTRCNLKGGYPSYEGYYQVPSSYRHPDQHLFHMYAQKFVSKLSLRPTVHIIFLSGGPGNKGRTYDDHISILLETSPKYACYTVDHRGLGESALITNDNLEDIVKNMKLISEKSPFPLKDLSLTNSARDVGTLALSIMASPNWLPSDQIILFGFSYGAHLAHHVVELFPNTFDHAFLLGVPPLKSLGVAPTHRGPVDMCELDPKCRRLMGGNVAAQIDRAIRNVTNPSYNTCTKLFSKSLDPAPKGNATQGDLMIDILYRLKNLIINRHPLLKKSDTNSIRVVLAVIKAINDCKNPSTFKKDVLDPLIPFMNDTSSSKQKDPYRNPDRLRYHQNPFKPNELVNAIILFDKDYDFDNHPPKTPQTCYNLSPAPLYMQHYYTRWLLIKDYLRGMERSIQNPIKTTKTHIHIGNGRMDMITTYGPTYARFQATTAPVKTWMLFNDREHDGLLGNCLFHWIHGASNGNYDAAKKCIKQTNRMVKLDWKFKRDPQFKSIWNQVNSAQSVPAMGPIDPISDFEYLIEEGHRVNFWILSVLLFIVLLLFVILISLLSRYYSSGKNVNDKK